MPQKTPATLRVKSLKLSMIRVMTQRKLGFSNEATTQRTKNALAKPMIRVNGQKAYGTQSSAKSDQQYNGHTIGDEKFLSPVSIFVLYNKTYDNEQNL